MARNKRLGDRCIRYASGIALRASLSKLRYVRYAVSIFYKADNHSCHTVARDPVHSAADLQRQDTQVHGLYASDFLVFFVMRPLWRGDPFRCGRIAGNSLPKALTSALI